MEKPVNLLISSTYVPRDEALEGTRRKDIFMGVWKGVLHNIPAMVTTLFNRNEVSIDISNLATGLYRNVSQAESLNAYGLFKFLDIKEMLKFETPKTVSCEFQPNQIVISTTYCVPYLIN